MVTIVFLLRRLDALSPDEFHEYWRVQHRRLVEEHAATLGMRRYSQLHTLDSPFGEVIRASRGCEPADFDGVALVWFDSLEALAAGTSTPEGQAAAAALLEDEKRFLDLERCVIWFAEDLIVMP